MVHPRPEAPPIFESNYKNRVGKGSLDADLTWTDEHLTGHRPKDGISSGVRAQFRDRQSGIVVRRSFRNTRPDRG